MILLHPIETSGSKMKSVPTESEFGAKRRVNMNNARMNRIGLLLEKGDFHQAALISDNIAWRYVYPVPPDTEIQIVFNFIADAVADLVPILGSHIVVDLHTALSVFFCLLGDIGDRDHILRTLEWLKIKNLSTSMLKGIDKIIGGVTADPSTSPGTSSSPKSFQAYYYQLKKIYKQFQDVMKRVLLLLEVMKDLPHPIWGWMKIMNDAAIFQAAQADSDGEINPHIKLMVKRLYVVAIKMFIRDSAPLRQTSKSDDEHGQDALDQLQGQFRWMASNPPGMPALKYCESLCWKSYDSEVREFAILADTFYHDRMAEDSASK